MKLLVILILTIVSCTLAFDNFRNSEVITELREDVADMPQLRNKIKVYEYAERNWINYEAMLKDGRAFYDNGRLITAAHYK